jgi:serine/threonine protein kinase
MSLSAAAYSYDVMQTPDSIVMVMEYLEGELFDYIVKRGRVSLFSSFRISTAS